MTSETLKGENKPTIFIWGDFREKSDLDRSVKDVSVLKLYDLLFEEIYFLVKSKKIRSTTIDVFRECLTSKSKILLDTGGKWAMKFTHYFEEFNFLLKELTIHNSASVRLNIVQSIWDYLPSEESIKNILSVGLLDKSAKVRFFSIDRIGQLKRSDFLNQLKNSLDCETVIENKEYLIKTISLLKLGYWIEDYNEENVMVWYDEKDGLSSFFLEKVIATNELILNRINNLRKESCS